MPFMKKMRLVQYSSVRIFETSLAQLTIVVTSVSLCLNTANVVVPLQPCATHSANDMDGQQGH